VADEHDKRPRRQTRAEKRAQTRRELLTAAEEVFRRRGFHGATVEEITAEAGYSRGAFYSNFESREALFVELLRERVYEDYRRMVERTPADLPASELISWGARALADQHRKPDQRWSFELWLELLAYATRHPEFAELAASFWRENRAALTAVISEAERAREGRPAADARLLATITIALDVGLKLQNLVDPEAVGLDDYERVFDLVIGSLVADEAEDR
jgi:TetR/AcrR family transcriptional regulator, transcriptional repressor of aconitase